MRAGAQPAAPVRVRLARVARAAALAVDGVAALSDGGDPARSVAAGDARIEGVACAARAEGGYDLTLYVIAAMVPLPALAGRVRDAVGVMTGAAGLGDQLGRVDVAIFDVVAG
jgi:hypothetical protein